jgi:hypothetical protein
VLLVGCCFLWASAGTTAWAANPKWLAHEWGPLARGLVTKPPVKGSLTSQDEDDERTAPRLPNAPRLVSPIGRLTTGPLLKNPFGNASPPPGLVANSALGAGPDPQIAVGHHFAVEAQAGAIEFVDKKLKQLKPRSGGVPTSIAARDFFSFFIQPTLSDGSPNLKDVNRYLPTVPGATCDLSAPPPAPVSGEATPDGPPPAGTCINDFYDVRVSYDVVHRRFVVVASARPQIWPEDPSRPNRTDNNDHGKLDAGAVRYFAIAVSRHEDPRDGFHQYFLVEDTQLTEWPMLSITPYALVIGHHGALADDGRPALIVVNVQQLEIGKPSPSYFTRSIGDFGGSGQLIPAQARGQSSGRVWLLNAGVKPPKVWAFPDQPVTGSVPLFAKGTLREPLGDIDFQDCDAWPQLCVPLTSGGIVTPPFYRSGSVYTVGSYVHHKGEPVRVRSVGIRVVPRGAKRVVASLKPADDKSIGGNVAAGDVTNWQSSAVAVTNDGDVVVGYQRQADPRDRPFGKPFFAQFTYSVRYHGKLTFRPTRRLSPQVVSVGPGQSAEVRQDHPSAALDPDGSRVWLAGNYVDKSRIPQMVVGWVRP